MFRFITISLWAGLSLAQTPADLFNKAPEDVDQALRARITQFYQLHVEGKFRQAEALVADDTKDFYYSANKTKYLSFEISQINYQDGFTKAKVTVICEQYVMLPGFGDKPLKLPIPSTWKLENGEWYWYFDQNAIRQTPFGTQRLGGRAGDDPPSPPKIPKPEEMKFIFSQVKADRESVSLKRGEPEQVTITNNAAGPMTIELTGKVPGVDVKLDRTNLKSGEKAVLTLKADSAARPGTVMVQVEQTNQVIPIQVVIP